MNLHFRHSHRAFTLVELLVVIGVIAVLIAILLPALNSARYGATHTVCASNIRQTIIGLTLYTNDNRSYYPSNGRHADTGERMHREFPSRLYRTGSGAYRYRGDLRPLIHPYLSDSGNADVMMCPFGDDFSDDKDGGVWGIPNENRNRRDYYVYQIWRGADVQGWLTYQLHFDAQSDGVRRLIYKPRMKAGQPMETGNYNSGNDTWTASTGKWSTLVNDFHGWHGSLHVPPGVTPRMNAAHFSLPGRWQGHQYYDLDVLGINYGGEDGSVIGWQKTSLLGSEFEHLRSGPWQFFLPKEHRVD